MRFEDQHSVYLNRCEEAIYKAMGKYFTPASQVASSAEYSLLNGGKRVRGVLVQAVSDLLGGDERAAAVFSAAIEMVHAFSLIHDDLPCMDDDDMRRGKPANHIVYGEATALLAGDALAIAAMEVIASAPFPAEMLVHATVALTRAAGDRGMIYGQELDLKYETQPADEAALLSIHKAKTGALIEAAAKLGIAAASLKPEDCASIIRFSNNVGLSFQIMDDVLDVVSSVEVLGKPIGSDKEQEKTTFVTLYGVDASLKEAGRLTSEAIFGLRSQYGNEADFLCTFAEQLSKRSY